MKRILTAAVLIAAFAAAALAAPGGLGWGFSKTTTITTTASSVTIPTCPNSGAPFGHLKVRAPATNSDLIYVRPEGVATTSDMSIAPGSSEEVSMTGSSVSVISASGTQAVEIVSSCGSRPR